MSWTWLILPLASLTAIWALLIGALIHTLRHPPRRSAGVALAQGLPIDPTDAGATSWQDVAIPLPDKGHMDCWWITGDNPTGPVVMVIHGWGDSRYGCLPWIPALRPVSSAIAMFDLRGHGDSTRRRCTFGRLECHDLKFIMAHARTKHPQKPIVLLGLSMGARIALRFASRNPGACDGVVIDSIYIRWSSALRATLKRKRLPAWPVVAGALGLMQCSADRQELRSDLTDCATQLTCRLVAIHGADDALSPPQDSRHLVNRAAQGHIKTWANTGHLEAHLMHPDEYGQAILLAAGPSPDHAE